SAPKTETVLAPPVAPAAPDTQPPSAPVLTGQLTNNVLLLTWQASTDNVGVDHYEIYLGGSPIGSLTRLSTQLTRKAFDPHGDSAYTVRAFDAAGNQSAASNAVTIEPVPRPSNVPAKIPRWAWKLLAFQDHRTGTRPKTPKPLPHWYAAWKKWRHGLFRLVG
ncbi:MAG TPA: hypothetical protein VJ814_03185, partial [Gaiellaceae bacterium]|nr:hypothetical protein [Gaiellaceae bacterium]